MPGRARVAQLVQAFAPLGFTLEPDGSTRPTVIDNLSGTELTVTLRSYVDRINSSPDDAPLQVGSGKELDEAAARHVLAELLGDYPVSGNFPGIGALHGAGRCFYWPPQSIDSEMTPAPATDDPDHHARPPN